MLVNNTLSLFLVVFILDLLVAAVRAALIHARLPHLIEMREQSPAAVDRAIHFLDDPRLRITLRVIVALVHIVLAVLAWLLLLDLFPLLQTPGVAAGLLLVFGLVVLVFEFAIEGYILRRPEVWTLRLVWVGRLIDFILKPFALVMVRLLGPSAMMQRQLSSVTDDELKNWVEAGQTEGSLEKGERKMIYSIFQFGETLCREVMERGKFPYAHIDMFITSEGKNYLSEIALDGGLKGARIDRDTLCRLKEELLQRLV